MQQGINSISYIIRFARKLIRGDFFSVVVKIRVFVCLVVCFVLKRVKMAQNIWRFA